MANSNRQTKVQEFQHEGNWYRHMLFPFDDRIECRNAQNEIILTYTGRCIVLNAEGKQIGRIILHRNPVDSYFFHPENGSETIDTGPHLLIGEMELSKLYLAGKIKAKE